MDHGPELTHTNLEEVGSQSSIALMKNPTKIHILNSITEFFGKFNIDVNAIQKPALEQRNLLLVEYNPEVLRIVNLAEAMASIGNEIFIKDFCITDITSPVPKRMRRQLQFMANFVLYATSKMAEIEDRLKEYRVEHKRFVDLRNQRMALIEADNAQALGIAKKLELNEQIESEIVQLRKCSAERKSMRNKAEEQLSDAERKKGEVDQRLRNLQDEAKKLKQKLAQAQSQSVKSPQRYDARLRDFTKRKNELHAKRAVREEAIQKEKTAIEHVEKCLHDLRREYEELSKITELYKRFAECKKIMAQGQEKMAKLRALCDEASADGMKESYRTNVAELQEKKIKTTKNLSNFRTELRRLTTLKNDLVNEIEDSEIRLRKTSSKTEKVRRATVEKEADCKKFIEDVQKLYDEEIKKELEMNSALRSLS